jgi:integrase
MELLTRDEKLLLPLHRRYKMLKSKQPETSSGMRSLSRFSGLLWFGQKCPLCTSMLFTEAERHSLDRLLTFLALLLGCGLRRQELAHLKVEDIVEWEGRTVSVDLVGRLGGIHSHTMAKKKRAPERRVTARDPVSETEAQQGQSPTQSLNSAKLLGIARQAPPIWIAKRPPRRQQTWGETHSSRCEPKPRTSW